jgi:membrane-associated phospholipid phosphatase
MRTMTLIVLLLASSIAPIHAQQNAPTPVRDSVGPSPGSWKTWVIASGRALRLPPPPDSQSSKAEIAELHELAAQREKWHERIVYWDTGAPSSRWVEIAVNRIINGPLKGLNAARHVALVNVALYDATIAAWDSKYAYKRQRPSEVDPSLTSAIAVPNSPSYPGERAVTAGAAAGVLSYLFPNDAKLFNGMAEEAAQSRVIAGLEYPSDAKAGLDLGRGVVERMIARAKADGFDAPWTGMVPSGPGLWNGTNPLMPLAGTWKTWVLMPSNRFRPEPPPAYDSPQKIAELTEIKGFAHTFDSNAKAFFAQTGDGNFGQWYTLATRWILEDKLDGDAPRAARIYAAMSMAQHDAMVACWEAKYTYWAIRPSQLDSDVKTLFPNPNHPSYPAAHGCGSGSISAAMAHFFPNRADEITARGEEMGWSRLWAGIHYRSDVLAGLRLGRSVAQVIIDAVESGETR